MRKPSSSVVGLLDVIVIIDGSITTFVVTSVFILTSVQWFETEHMASDRTWHPGPAGCDHGWSLVVVVEVERNGIRDWHVMDAGSSNSIHLFIRLLRLVMSLSFSSREWQAERMSTWPGRLTDSDLSWFKELVNLYDVKAGGLSVYFMLMRNMVVV